MAPKALEILKKGLSKFKETIKIRKNELDAKLARAETISSADEHWLDHVANTVDEQRIIDNLEAASDYERGLERLDENGKAIINKLREWAGDLAKVSGNKRKRSAYEKEPKPAKKQIDKSTIPPVFTKKENATLAQRIEILDWHHKNGGKQTKTARHFDKIYPNLRIKQPLVSSWIKEESKWREQWKQTNHPCDRTTKRTRQTEHPAVTEMMDLWVSKAMEHDLLLTGEVLRQKWAQFADLAGIPEDERLNLSSGWLSRFKTKHGLTERRRHGEAASAHAETVEKERKRVQELIAKYGYKLRDIFNMDETGLFWAMMPDRGLANHKRSGVKGKKLRLTYALTSNADGSEKLPPFIIGKAAKPRAFNKKTGTQLGFRYRNNAKAWMTAVLYQEWLQEWDRKLGEQNRKILLLQDNFSGYIVPENLRNICVENFEPNLTAHVQPKDQGIIRCFKAHYRAMSIQRAINRYDDGITPAEIYELDQLTAMRLAHVAWRDVDTTTIRNCWRKAGILPDMDSTSSPVTQPSIPISSLLDNPSCQTDLIADAEKQLENALDELVARGALQANNRMDIESLLNPVGETEVMTEVSDKEIYEAVMASRAARENIETNGGDDVDEDRVPSKPRPTRRQVLTTLSTIGDYLEELNSPLARRLEADLYAFNRELRIEEMNSKKETLLTDFFLKN